MLSKHNSRVFSGLEFLRSIKYKLQTKLSLVDFNTIYFEGGLGSQLLAYILFEHRSQNNKKVLCDLTYFKDVQSDSHTLNKVSLWSYKLSHYKIAMNDLPNQIKKSRVKVKPKFLPIDFLGIDKFLLNKVKSKVKSDLNNLSLYLEKFDIKLEDSYGVIHIRKGDYLFVASHLISETQVIGLLSKIGDLLPKELFIASDGLVDNKLLDWLKENKPSQKVFVVEKDIDTFLLHDLMRNSRVLVTANSTFSFSAALLSSDKTISFIPQIFYQEDLKREKDSSGHRFASDYGILRY
jgi:hypothetical protein